MRIVYDKTQTREKGLAGWSFPLPGFSGHLELSPTEETLWRSLAPGHPPLGGSVAVADPSLKFWSQLYLVGESGQSQYDILRQCPFDNDQHYACIALSGNGFHGQHYRPWQALQGNLHLSVSVPLNMEAGPRSLVWTMLPAVAVMRTLKSLKTPENDLCGIKWVNDVLWGGAKLAGVISSLVVIDGRARRGFLGIGLNLAQSPSLPVKTCFLHQFLNPRQASLGLILHTLLASLADLIVLMEKGQDEVIIHEYRHHSLVIGRQVRLMSDPADGSAGAPAEEICEGKVLKINADLGLVLAGKEAPLHHGRLQILK